MVEKTGADGRERVARKLASVKVVVDLLNHELDLAKAEKAVQLDRERLDAVVTTLEDFVVDVEAALRSGEERRTAEAPRATVNRVT